VGRRDFLKGLATIPVFGAFITSFIAKQIHEKSHKEKIFSEFDLQETDIDAPHIITKDKPGELIHVGIIGVGDRGLNLLEALGYYNEKAPDDETNYSDLNIEIVGVCDVYDKHAERGIELSRLNRFSEPKKSSHAAKRYHHYQDMLQSEDIDALIIATPDHWHAQMVIDAAEAGKHIYCEKCLTRTIEEAFAVRNAIKKSNIIFQYGHQNRQQKSYQLARQIIDKEILGKITMIKTHTNRNTPRGAWIRHTGKEMNPRDVDWKQWLGPAPFVPFTISRYYGWQKFFEYSGGLPAHMFSHEYDAINQILQLGIPKSVVASGGTYYWKDERNTPDLFQAVFNYPDKELILTYDAMLASSSTGEYEVGAKVKEIFGSDAWLKLSMNINVMVDKHSKRFKDKIDDGIISPLTPMLSYTPGAKSGGFDVVTSASERFYASQGLVYTYQQGKKINVTYLHLKEWFECIRNGGKTSCNIDSAFEDAITCLMATKSYMEGRQLEWDAVNERII